LLLVHTTVFAPTYQYTLGTYVKHLIKLMTSTADPKIAFNRTAEKCIKIQPIHALVFGLNLGLG